MDLSDLFWVASELSARSSWHVCRAGLLYIVHSLISVHSRGIFI
jgi:hypothetical protein